MDQLHVATSFSVSIVAVSIFWFIIKAILNSNHSKNPPLPPGPRGLPIVGYLPFLGQTSQHPFAGLAQKYGPIYKLRLGTKLHVVITSPSLVRQIVRDQDATFANRDVHVAASVASYDKNDLAWAPNDSQWRGMRKMFVREILSNTNLEASYVLRRDEVRKSITHANTKTGTRVGISELIFLTELNVIMNMVWGGTLESEEQERVGAKFWAFVSKLNDLIGTPNISDYFPLLSRLDIQGIKKQTQRIVQSIDGIFDSVVDKRKMKLSEPINLSEGRKDYLQILLELKEKEDSNMSISDEQFKALLLNIVAGGTDTTTSTAEWAMAELLSNPDAMKKVQNELSDVVGLNNMVEEHHMPKLRYLDAVLKETMRLHPVVPLLVPRSPSQASIIGGYIIPKDTRVFIDVWTIQRDPSIWDDPLRFKPDRFLSGSGKLDYKGNSFEYLPFGSGRRICAGLPLAERMLMYILASFLHSFDWKLGAGEKLDMSERFGIVMRKNMPLFAVPTPRLSDSYLYM